MKVLYVTDAIANWGGIERILVEKANFLVDNCGFDVHFITVNQGTHPILFSLSQNIHYSDLDIRFHQQYEYNGFRRFIKKWKLKRLFAERLRKYINEIKPNIIISARAELISGILASKGRIPFVYESHSSYISDCYLSDGWFSLLKSRRLNYRVRHAEMVVALSNGDASDWKRITPNVCVIPNIVSLNKTGSYSSCENKIAIFVGRFSKQKDIGTLLKIWSIVSNRYPDWQLHIYGGFGEEQNQLIDIIREKYKNICVFPPTIDILEKYRESSLLLLTSLFEPFGLVLPEAMSCGLPVIAFDCPYGPREIIVDGVDGFVISNRDIHQYVEKVCLLMGNQDLRVKMGKEGVKSASRFEDKKIMPQWISLFKTLARENLVKNK